MSVKTILSTDSYDLLFHEEDKIIHHILKPSMDDDDNSDVLKGKRVTKWQKLLTVGTDTLIKYGAEKWVSDNRALQKPHSTEDNQWINGPWLERTMAAGWGYWALIVPKTTAAQSDMVKYVRSFYDTGVWVTVHSSEDDAFAWIKTADKVSRA